MYLFLTLSVVGVERSMSRDREADVEGAKNLGLVHLRRSKGLCFRAKAPKETNGEARSAEPMLWLW